MKPQAVAWVVTASVAAFAFHLCCALALVGTLGTPPPQVCPPAAPPVALAAPRPAFALDNLFMPPGPGQGQVVAPTDVQRLRGTVVPARDCVVSGPFTHANLSVYLVHGPDTLKGPKVLPLQRAVEQNLAVVHEGLAIDNRADVPVFIQAGDIVKGGNQDRTLPYDQLIPPHATRLPLMAFCVEAGRSGPRGQELSASFQSSTEQLPGRRLNLAARYNRSQGDVWNGVREVQQALAGRLGGPVHSPLSQTSLQLTLENDRVQTALQSYLNDLAPAAAREKGAIGVVVAVNGQLQGAEVYASSDLFQDLWPKLLKASAVGALAERQPGSAAGAAPSLDAARQFLADAEAGQACRQESAHGVLVLRQETPRTVLFDTCDPARQNLVIHRSILTK